MRQIKFVLTMIILLVACSGQVLAAAGDTPSSWAKAEVKSTISKGLVPIRLQWKYQDPITREEFAELLVLTVIAKHNATNKSESPWTIPLLLERVQLMSHFEDTNEAHIKAAYALGSINGVSDTKFAPNATITRQEAATMLINTIHYSSGITYDNKVKKSYADFGRIAKWAQPAVLASGSLKLMLGVGKKFDYSGKFTREQSIAIMNRLYNDIHYDTLTIRGHIPIYSDNKTINYKVGKTYVYLLQAPKFDEGMQTDPVVEKAKADWVMYNGGTPSTTQASIAYLFKSLRTNTKEVIEATSNNKSIMMDYGYMVMTTLTEKHLIEFALKPDIGYMTTRNEYSYGFPKVAVKPKVHVGAR